MGYSKLVVVVSVLVPYVCSLSSFKSRTWRSHSNAGIL